MYNFINRINTLVKLDALSIEKDLHFKFVSGEDLDPDIIQTRAAEIDIMYTTRKHASELRSVYDNAPFGTRNLTAGLYFAERVRYGGIWDYKATLGTTTQYYVSDVGARMAGESIGNFHYDYVGSSCFSATVLKSAAGMAQLINGTSSWSYWNTFFDDPRDQQQIQKGIDWYNAGL